MEVRSGALSYRKVISGLALGCFAALLVNCARQDFSARFWEISEKSKWAVGSPSLGEENKIRKAQGIRTIDAGWRLRQVESRDVHSSPYLKKAGDLFSYEKTDQYGLEVKEVWREPISGKLIGDEDIYPSGRKYDSEADGPGLDEQICSAYAFGLRALTSAGYFGNRDRYTNALWNLPTSPESLDQIVKQMRTLRQP